MEGENSPSLFTSRRPIEILGCAAKSRPDFGAGMTACPYDHSTAELLHNHGIRVGGGFPSMSKRLNLGRKYGNTRGSTSVTKLELEAVVCIDKYFEQ